MLVDLRRDTQVRKFYFGITNLTSAALSSDYAMKKAGDSGDSANNVHEEFSITAWMFEDFNATSCYVPGIIQANLIRFDRSSSGPVGVT